MDIAPRFASDNAPPPRTKLMWPFSQQENGRGCSADKRVLLNL